MLVDTDDLLVDAEDEKDNVAIITPESEADQPAVPRADDCTSSGPLPRPGSLPANSQVVEAMKELVLPPLEGQPPILLDATHTWEIENWKAEPRRAHGPIFEAGGHPWYVIHPRAGSIT